MARPITKYLIVPGIVFAALLVAAVVGILGHSLPRSSDLPNPNGYDDFTAAGKMIKGNASEQSTLDEEPLRTLVSKNAEALKRIKTGLTRDCRVPLDYSATNETRLKNLQLMKAVAHLLVAEGRLAELEKRPGDAAHSYLQTVRLGCEISRGGVLIDGLVGIAVEGLGATSLERIVPGLNAAQCRELAAALEAAEARQDSAETILQQEKAWSRRMYGWRAPIIRTVMFKTYQQTETSFQSKFKPQQMRLRMLMLQLAARAFELEKGSRPTSSAELVPVYLKAVPKDPVSGVDIRLPR